MAQPASGSPADYHRDPSLSLAQKWRLHAAHKRKHGTKTNPELINTGGPWVLLFVLCGCGGWGTVVAMPTMYEANGWEAWLPPAYALAAFLVTQVCVNWALTRWVGSEYVPAVHGTEPTELPARYDGRDAWDSAFNSGSDSARAENSPNLLLSAADRSGVSNAPSAGIQLASHGDSTATSSLEKRSSVLVDSNAVHSNNGVAKPAASEAVDFNYAPPNPGKCGTYDGYSYRMLVATALPTSEGHVERKPFPYWSWAPCLMCQRSRPPRCHHCVLCRKCVLKRDHHCYLTGACIGVNNQRFFLVFLLWASALTVFTLAHMLPYTYYYAFPQYGISILDFFPPFSLIRGLLGFVSPVIFVLSLLFWLLILFTLFSLFMLVGFTVLLTKGLTSFEREHRIKVTDTRSLAGRLRSVFGEYWWVNVLFPTYPWFKPAEDAVLWPHIKPY